MSDIIQIEVAELGDLVAQELIWMHQNADMTNKERKAYEVVIRDFLNQTQQAQFFGEEIDE